MSDGGKIELEFHQRPVDVPPDLRLYRRLAMLCISISACCYKNTASFHQLHFVNSLLIDDDFRALYLEFRSKRISTKILNPSADPYLNRCVNYAIGANLLEQKNIQSGFKVALTQEGKDFVTGLRAEGLAADVFAATKLIGRVSETEIRTALKEGL